MKSIKDAIRIEGTQTAELLDGFGRGERASVFGLRRADEYMICACLDKFVFVASDVQAAYEAFGAFSSMRENVVIMTAKDNVLMPIKASASQQAARFKAQYMIAANQADIIVTEPESLIQLYPTRSDIVAHSLTFARGKKIDLVQAAALLVKSGYERDGHVTVNATFAIRGDILDIVLPDGDAYRIEFFGDEVESVRTLDIAEQSSIGEVETVTAYPATDVFYDEAQAAKALAKLRAEAATIKKAREKTGARTKKDERNGCEILIETIERGQTLFPCAQSLFESERAFEFFALPIVVSEAKKCYDGEQFAYREHKSRFQRLYEAHQAALSSLDNLSDCYSDDCVRLVFHEFDSQNRYFNPEKLYRFKGATLPTYTNNFVALADDINGWLSLGRKVYVGADYKSALEKLNCFGANFDYRFERGAVLTDIDSVFVGRGEISKKQSERVKRKSALKELPSVGDYVVHETHGIGMCEAVGSVTIGGATRDYITVRYQGSDKLLVPVENLDILSKYDGDTPKLSRLGGAEFERVKNKIRTRLKKQTLDLMTLYAERACANTKPYSKDDSLLEEFCASFPFEETPDQMAAVQDVLHDLKSGKTMDRLICGDVGFGKTEVALRAAFKTICEGGQVAFMSPTTVLCRQHYNTTVKRMEQFGVSVAMLSRFTDNPKKVVDGLKEGTIDIVCGTHRLLDSKIKYRNLRLLILDEEQKFGVVHKEKIKEYRKDIHVLTLSATPIPRTLHMALSGIRDVSTLETAPKGRLPAQVYVAEYSTALCADAISREINRGGQVFVVYNYVHSSKGTLSIEEFSAQLRDAVPNARITFAHGQMDKKLLEESTDSFINGEADVLVATTIIENGIDIPRANTLVVYGAERLGLSQMYQLKGRVGRNDRVAQVYFTYSPDAHLTEAAVKRLETMNEFTDPGSGIKVAEADMRLRGVGDVFGSEQHGHMEQVGYSLYMKLLREAVSAAKGDSVRIEKEPTIRAEFSAYVPASYCDSGMRMNIYRRVSELDSLKARANLMSDLQEGVGAIPPCVKNLITVGLCKNRARKIHATAVTLLKQGARIEFEDIEDVKLGYEKSGGVLNAQKKPIIVVFATVSDLMEYLLDDE